MPPSLFRFLLLLLLSLPGLTGQAQHRYWDADYDSLRLVLNRQRTDTARLRTIVHLLDVIELTEPRRRVQALPLLEEVLRVNTRTPSFNDRPYELLRTGLVLWVQGAKDARTLNMMQQAVGAFDEAKRPIPRLLIDLAPLYNQLKLPQARYAYFQKKLSYYRLHGSDENAAACYLVLGGSYRHLGDYDQAISHYLRAADLFRKFDRMLYTNELMVAGSAYADWGNAERALHYLQQARNLESRYKVGGLRRFYILEAISRLHLQKRHYAQALRYADLGLAAARQDTVNGHLYTAYGLLIKSMVLLQQGSLTQAGMFLTRTQHLADSLQLPITGRPGELQLDATWAQYYTARHNYERAEQHWLTAYQKAAAANLNGLRASYLKQIIRFYDLRRQPAQGQHFSRAYMALTDSMSTAQSAYHLAQYEGERVEQAQSEQIANLRQAQAVQQMQLRQRNQLLLGALTAIVLVSGLGGLVYWQLRRNRRTLRQLRQTQNQLIASEKWAFVGELSAGIAHELQNPLSFMKKFAEVSTAMIDGMPRPGRQPQDGTLEQEILAGLKLNLQEISQHGVRASSIIKDMLDYSRAGTGQREPTDIASLIEEYLRLAYQGLQSQDKSFQATLDFTPDPTMQPASVVPQDMGRVLLNLFTNALHAVRQRRQHGTADYQPTVRISTRQLPGQLEIRVADNGTGMPESVRARAFEPFFTTKAAGEGTGLGLSLSVDIIKAHGGTLRIETQDGQGTDCIILLPVPA